MEQHSTFNRPDPNLPTSTDWPTPATVLLVLVAAGLFSMLLAGLFLGAWQASTGTDVLSVVQGIDADAELAERQLARLVQGLSHVFMFIIPSLLALLYYQRTRRRAVDTHFSWGKDIGMYSSPTGRWLGIGVLLMVISLPLVHYAYALNKALPLPDWMRNSEADITKALEGFLIMESPLELLFNVFIVAVLPAIGEELMFRGVIQKQLMRRMRPWVAIIVSGAVFSAIHMQFEGFVPRWIMGIVLGWLFWKSSNLWVPIVVHFLNNGLQVIGYYFFKEESDVFDVDAAMEVPHWIGILSLISVLLFMAYFEKNKIDNAGNTAINP